ncbi:MAG: hypothetical protein HYZ42_15305 [Bacteroidetes bacterium]|nr:hypothetical protein [Bacteroidota bacterium]
MFKYIYIVFVILFVTHVSNGQVPRGINFQGVARNSSGVPLANKLIGIEVSLFDSNTARQNEYIETHSITTNALGLYTLVIGKGNSIVGNFDSIKWQNSSKWIEVKIDPNGSNNYIVQAVQQLMSVPYALYAGNASTKSDIQTLSLQGDSILLSKNGGGANLAKYLDNTDSQILVKSARTIGISNGNTILLNDDDSTNEIQQLSISNDTLKISKTNSMVVLPNPLDAMEDAMGCVFVHRFCTGDGTITNPWKSADSSAGLFEAIKHLSPTKRIVYLKPGYYFTQGNIVVDFEKLLPNLNNANWRNAFAGYGIEFQGHNASIYVNGGNQIKKGKPGILFNWKGANVFYWKFNGLQFYGNVDTALVQFGNEYEFPLNGCEFDIVANNGYAPANYATTASRSSAIKICFALESKLHLVGVSATGCGVVLETVTFCTISGAYSNTIIPNTNNIYPYSYGLCLKNCQSNNFTHMDLEVAYNGIKFDAWSIQNTFSAIFVANCDSSGSTFDNSTQATNGKNVVVSIRSGSTLQNPSNAVAQRLYTTGSNQGKLEVINYFDF